MKIKSKQPPQPLAKGQLWQINEGYMQIVELGKRLVHYKVLKQPGQRAVRTRMSGIAAFEAYLNEHAAKLVS